MMAVHPWVTTVFGPGVRGSHAREGEGGLDQVRGTGASSSSKRTDQRREKKNRNVPKN
jgi:hypothetical protein